MHGFSEHRARQAVEKSRSVARHQRCPDRDREVIALLLELAERYPERKFRKRDPAPRTGMESQTGVAGVLRVEAQHATERQEAVTEPQGEAADGGRKNKFLLIGKVLKLI